MLRPRKDERNSILLRDFETGDQQATRRLILDGLAERFGTIIEGPNGDLDDISSLHRRGRTVVAQSDGEIVAIGSVVRQGNAAQIVRMSVACEYRRRGLGAKVLAELIETARGWRVERVVLETNSDWLDAIDFYLANGFRITHIARGDYGDEVWFELKL